MEPIEFISTIAKVQTLVDGGIRVAFDMPETATMQMAQLAECRRAGLPLRVRVDVVPEAEEEGWQGDGLS